MNSVQKHINAISTQRQANIDHVFDAFHRVSLETLEIFSKLLFSDYEIFLKILQWHAQDCRASFHQLRSDLFCDLMHAKKSLFSVRIVHQPPTDPLVYPRDALIERREASTRYIADDSSASFGQFDLYSHRTRQKHIADVPGSVNRSILSQRASAQTDCSFVEDGTSSSFALRQKSFKSMPVVMRDTSRYARRVLPYDHHCKHPMRKIHPTSHKQFDLCSHRTKQEEIDVPNSASYSISSQHASAQTDCSFIEDGTPSSFALRQKSFKSMPVTMRSTPSHTRRYSPYYRHYKHSNGIYDGSPMGCLTQEASCISSAQASYSSMKEHMPPPYSGSSIPMAGVKVSNNIEATGIGPRDETLQENTSHPPLFNLDDIIKDYCNMYNLFKTRLNFYLIKGRLPAKESIEEVEREHCNIVHNMRIIDHYKLRCPHSSLLEKTKFYFEKHRSLCLCYELLKNMILREDHQMLSLIKIAKRAQYINTIYSEYMRNMVKSLPQFRTTSTCYSMN